MSNYEPPILIVDCGTITSLPVTVSDSRIRSSHKVVGYEASNDFAIVDDWTVSVSEGVLTISGNMATVSGVSKVNVVLKIYLCLPHHVYIDDSGHGTAIASPENAVITDMVSLTPVPNTRYRFVEWESVPDAEFIGNSFLMPGTDITVTPVFERYVFDVQISGSNQGTAIASPAYAESGETISLTSVPSERYKFVRWESNPSVSFTDNTFVMPNSDITIVPVFERYDSDSHAGYYNGTYYLSSVPMYYDGTNWIECELKYYANSNWQNADST